MKAKFSILIVCMFFSGCVYDPPTGDYYFQISNSLNYDLYCGLTYGSDFLNIDTSVNYEGMDGIPKQGQII